MSFLFASSHLPAFKRPEDEEDDKRDDDVQPMRWGGGVRAFSHLPERSGSAAPRPTAATHLPSWITEPSAAEHAQQADTAPGSRVSFTPPAPRGGENDTGKQPVYAGGHGGFAPSVPAGTDNHGSAGPLFPHGAQQPAGGSLFQAQRPMPPQYPRPQATPYGAPYGSGGNASKPNPGSQPAAPGLSTGPSLLDNARKNYNPELTQADRDFEARLAAQREAERQADNAKLPLQQHEKSIKADEAIRIAVKIAKKAQDLAKKRMRKEYRKPFDEVNKGLGIDPDTIIEKYDERLRKKREQLPEYEKSAAQFDDALRQAEKESEEAGRRLNKLKEEHEKRQQQPAVPPPMGSPAEFGWPAIKYVRPA